MAPPPTAVHRAYRSPRPPGGRGALAPILVAAMALSSVLLLGGATGGTTSVRAGEVTVFLPRSGPCVRLVQEQNSSITAELCAEYVLELTASYSVVRYGSLANETLNQSGGTGSSSLPIALTGSVPVVNGGPRAILPGLRSNDSAPTSSGPLPVPSSTTLQFRYQLLGSGARDPGLSISWSVLGWPWLSSSDLLGIALALVVPNSSAFALCSANPPLGSGTAGACGSPFGEGQAVSGGEGNSSVGGIVGDRLSGTFSWGTAGRADGGPEPVNGHAVGNGSATAQISLEMAGGGAANDTLSGELLLPPPWSPSVPSVLHFDPAAYLAAGALFTAFAVIATGVYRHRESRALEEL